LLGWRHSGSACTLAGRALYCECKYTQKVHAGPQTGVCWHSRCVIWIWRIQTPYPKSALLVLVLDFGWLVRVLGGCGLDFFFEPFAMQYNPTPRSTTPRHAAQPLLCDLRRLVQHVGNMPLWVAFRSLIFYSAFVAP
jgi:hypothetical protein